MARYPTSTYRLQMGPDFGFAEAHARLDYLHRLGVGDVYLSPILRARPGSTHGYDCADPTSLNAELGTRAELGTLSQELQRKGMGLLLDIVPNHMAAHPCNPWWSDVLRQGTASRYARHFDIRWRDEQRVTLPVLGSPVSGVLERGEISIDGSGDEAQLAYFEHRFPLNDRGRDLARAGAPIAEILGAQHYRLMHWRKASAEINYRRFFDISDLVGVRVEDSDVFDDTHTLIRELVAEGIVTGLRIDHIDGLLDPASYLVRLQERVIGGEHGHGYVVVEKILEAGEALPGDWPVDGTTGYDFLNTVNGLFVASSGLDELSGIYARFTGVTRPFEDVVFSRKLQVQDELFSGELDALTDALLALRSDLLPAARAASQVDAASALAEAAAVRAALAAVTAALPRYRTYFARDRIAEDERMLVRTAVAEAADRVPEPGETAYALIEHALTLRGHSPPDVPAAELAVVTRWQQYTGPVMAKGHEDTALYVYNRLLSANAVGSNPAEPASSIEEFHGFCRRRSRVAGSLNATSTHDGKRSEDMRARIDVLSEMPQQWDEALARWHALNADLARTVDGRQVPDANIEILAYQTMVGAWPLDDDELPTFADRLREYLLKAAREAKTHTSWLDPDAAYEDALGTWAAAALGTDRPLIDEMREFTRTTSFHGALTSLAQVLLRAVTPGVPDVYQGTELWDLSMVDPDNRRPVDWQRRERLLRVLQRTLDRPNADAARELWTNWKDGLVKLFTTATTLQDRRRAPELYAVGEYVPLRVRGPMERHLIALARRRGEEWRIAVAPLRTCGLRPTRPAADWPIGADVWQDNIVELPASAPARWLDRFTGAQREATLAGTSQLAVAELFRNFPLALLQPAR